MPALRSTRVPTTVLSNRPPSLEAPIRAPLANKEFKHQLTHCNQQLGNALMQAQKVKHYGLGADTEPEHRAMTNSLQAVRQLFERQMKQRAELHTHRCALPSRTESSASSDDESSATGSTNAEFKPVLALLPLPAASGIASDCCADQETNVASGGCDHEGSNGIVLDLDEMVHGAYASVKYLSQAADGEPSKVLDTFRAEAQSLSDKPLAHLGHELAESGVGQFAAATGTSVVMLPLAALAIQAGIEEYQHAGHAMAYLKATRAKVQARKEALELARQLDAGGVLESRSKVIGIEAERTAQALVQARKDRHIGFSSAASGLSIGLKALSDLGLKISLGVKGALSGKSFFALGETAQAGAAAATATTVFGVAGTFVLGPLAGAFATALGAFFTVKSLQKHRQLKTDFGNLQHELKHHRLTEQGELHESHQVLEAFLLRQGEKRIGFFKRFSRWNKAFMVGSGLYAASATTKAVVVGLALAGIVGAASNPAGLIAITAVGVIGAVVMGIASLSFIRGHGKQGKYNRATQCAHTWVDRALLGQLHVHGNGEERFKLAASQLAHLDARKAALKTFLNDAASAGHKQSPLHKHLSWWQHLRGQVLGQKGLTKYLGTEAGHGALKNLVKTCLTAQLQALKEQIQARQAVNQGLMQHVEETLASPTTGVDAEEHQTTPTQLDGLSQVLGEIDAEFERDQSALELTQLRLSQLDNDQHRSVPELMKMLTQDEPKNIKASAKVVLNSLDTDIRQARGVLFESMLDGARLRQQAYERQQKKPA